ncbi:MAG: hypothetical protein PHX08_06695 [Lachnospiraceae bacterium]|nr:hypothetical protein [Lachnospiraceae bacterium]
MNIGTGLMEPIITGIINIIMKIIAGVWNLAIKYISTDFKPDLESFDSYFATGALAKMCQIFTIMGCILATSIFLFQLLIMLKARKGELRNTPWSLLARFIISMVLVTVIGVQLPAVAVNITSDVWHIMRENTSDIDTDIDTSTAINESYMGDGSDANIAERQKTSSIWLGILDIANQYKDGIYYTIVFPFIYCFLMITVLMSIFKLLMVIIERYVIMNVMARMFPVVAATYTSSTTSNILTSYSKMFISQLFLVSMSLFFSQGFVYICMAESGKNFTTFMGICFVLAYLRCAEKIDSYISALGINVAQAGGIIDTALSDFRGLASMARMGGKAKDNAGAFIRAGERLAGAKEAGNSIKADATMGANATNKENSKSAHDNSGNSGYGNMNQNGKMATPHENNSSVPNNGANLNPMNGVPSDNNIKGENLNKALNGENINTNTENQGKSDDLSKKLNDGNTISSGERLEDFKQDKAEQGKNDINQVLSPDNTMTESDSISGTPDTQETDNVPDTSETLGTDSISEPVQAMDSDALRSSNNTPIPEDTTPEPDVPDSKNVNESSRINSPEQQLIATEPKRRSRNQTIKNDNKNLEQITKKIEEPEVYIKRRK